MEHPILLYFWGSRSDAKPESSPEMCMSLSLVFVFGCRVQGSQ
uniref:Uncharacterized protein n=1 Tax=Arundo donax TaxID=35708 RepID=A0A0A8Z459_ARUDO